ncbi:MAG: hypothetical protein IBJ03_00420 [Gemmatimonadaceae bacterium]|nr:hypothetical protein [Gemmatimonadaceae bacterium]
MTRPRPSLSTSLPVLWTVVLLVACTPSDDVTLTDSTAAAPGTVASAAPPTPALSTPAEAAPVSQLPASVVQKGKNNQSAEYLSLFEAPAQLVVLAPTTSLPLWDLIGTAANAVEDPKALLDPGMSMWTQVEGPATRITEGGTLRANAAIGPDAINQNLTYRLSITNASGGRTVEVRVKIEKK